MRADLEVQLLTDVSLSATARTLGTHETLDHIPGRVLWGVAASRAYQNGMHEAEAFRLFQQGAVRFFDAVPCASRTNPAGVTEWGRGAPTPRSWHRPKYGDRVRNFAIPRERTEATGEQYEALAVDWRAPDGAVIGVSVNFAMRTAIDGTGRARTGMLFGLASIPAGTHLHACVEGTDSDVERVCTLLNGECRVGRSRSAEYGLISIRRREATALRLKYGSSGYTKRVTLLCISRLALRDPRTGSPTFVPTPEALGLEGAGPWQLDPDSSFVRTTSYSPYHQKRGRPETERWVIERGSVLVFEGPGSSVEELRRALAGGAGEWRYQGLGDVAIDPEWLTEPRPALPGEATWDLGSGLQPGREPDDDLYRWASAQAKQRRSAREQFEWAESSAGQLIAFDLPPSQWGLLRGLARQARYREGGSEWLRGEIERLIGHGVRALSSRWGKRLKGRTAAQALRDALSDAGEDLPIRLELLAGRAVRPGADREKGGLQ